MHCSEEKWIGGVLAPNGKIIGIPYAAESVLEIDPVARSATTFGVVCVQRCLQPGMHITPMPMRYACPCPSHDLVHAHALRRSSSLKRKWVEGVLGRNGLIYGIPYDADVVLEIDPDNHAMILFGHVGNTPCKWYGGVLAPNDKIYAIPYSAMSVLEIDPELRTANTFAMVDSGWGKWAGGILAGNGKIYAVPALATAILEIDIDLKQTNLFGMLPGGGSFDDKWNGAVVAPNGKMYGIPWRSNRVLEFDPDNKAIALVGQVTSTNFSWHGGALAKDGRIIAVPYNSAYVLEIGQKVCSTTPPKPVAYKDPVGQASLDVNGHASAPSLSSPPELFWSSTLADATSRVFVLALLGCTDAEKSVLLPARLNLHTHVFATREV